MSTLSTISVGDFAIIDSLKCSIEQRKLLLSMGFTPSTEVQLVRIAPLGDPLEFSLRGFNVSLRKSEADVIKVIKKPKACCETESALTEVKDV